jgi:phosphoenolpyruvate carboxykinase (ATP)
VFNVEVPMSCPGVPQDVLDPRKTWPDGKAYDEQAKNLAAMFADNFKRFEQDVPAAVRDAGPRA